MADKNQTQTTEVENDDFVTFSRTRNQSEDPTPKVRVTKSGIASFNKAASDLLGGAAKMDVAVSASRRMVRAKASDTGSLKVGWKNGRAYLNVEPAMKYGGCAPKGEVVVSEPVQGEDGYIYFAC